MTTNLPYVEKVKKYTKFVTAQDKFWYNNFQWKIVFSFSKLDKPARWGKLRETFAAKNTKFYKRVSTIYTSVDGLEIILDEALFRNNILAVEYTSDQFNTELSVLGEGVANHIKFCKNIPKMPYLVKLDRLDYYYRTSNPTISEDIAKFLMVNKDVFELPTWARDVKYAWSGLEFYANSVDDIMMLHFIAPGCIKRVTKLITRNVKRSKQS